MNSIITPRLTKEEDYAAREWVRTSPACHYWLKQATHDVLQMDPVDAYKDVQLLFQICEAQLQRGRV